MELSLSLADAPAAAQLSQAEIIERQAETIARLKRQAERSAQYKTLTKEKLKEAAQRLREYRLRVEALLQDVEDGKRALQALEQTQRKAEAVKSGRGRRTTADAAVLATVSSREVAVQTVRQTAACSTQTALSGAVQHVVPPAPRVECGIQTVNRREDTLGEAVGKAPATKKQRRSFDPEGNAAQLTPQTSRGVVLSRMLLSEDEEGGGLEAGEPLQPLQLLGSPLKMTALPFSDATSAAIDAELELSDSEEEEESDRLADTLELSLLTPPVELSNAHVGAGKTASGQQIESLDAAVASEIDKELEMSSDEEEEGPQSAGLELSKPESEAGREAAGSDRLQMSIDEEIDAELATSESEAEQERGRKEEGNTEQKAASSSSESSESSESDSSDSSDGSEDEGDDVVDEIERDLMGESATAAENSELSAKDRVSTPVNASVRSAGDTEQREEELNTRQQAMDLAKEASKCKDEDEETPALPEKGLTVVRAASIAAQETAIGTSPPSRSDSKQLTGTPDSSQVEEVAVLDDGEREPAGIFVDVEPSATKLPTPETLGPVVVNDRVGTDLESGEVDESPSTGRQSPTPRPTKEALAPAGFDSEDVKMAEAVQAQVPASISAPNAASTPVRASQDQADVPVDAEIETTPSQATSSSPKRALDSTRQVEGAVADAAMPPPMKKRKTEPLDPGKKRELQLGRAVAAFKRAIALSKGEESDELYVRRTFAALVKSSAKFLVSQPDHVTTLCHLLAESFRKTEISSIVLVQGALRVFCAPRSRHILAKNESLGLSWLCHQVLLGLIGHEGGVSGLHDCLELLRGLLVQERSDLGENLSLNSSQQQILKPRKLISHDKAFLAHACALHLRICQSLGQLPASRVLLFDLIRSNPDIKGVYFAMVMLEIAPELLAREFDAQCCEKRIILKDTLLHALVAIASVASRKQQILLGQSGMALLHRISEAIQMPELLGVDADNPSFHETFVAKLWTRLAQDSAASDRFQLAKSLELTTVVHGLEAVTQSFSLERCRRLLKASKDEKKAEIVVVVAHIALATAEKKRKLEDLGSQGEQYVEQTIDWLGEVLATVEAAEGLVLECAAVCVDLVLASSPSTGLSRRRQTLCAVLKWFEKQSVEQLQDCPASFLRRLRLAVVAARPSVLGDALPEDPWGEEDSSDEENPTSPAEQYTAPTVEDDASPPELDDALDPTEDQEALEDLPAVEEPTPPPEQAAAVVENDASPEALDETLDPTEGQATLEDSPDVEEPMSPAEEELDDPLNPTEGQHASEVSADATASPPPGGPSASVVESAVIDPDDEDPSEPEDSSSQESGEESEEAEEPDDVSPEQLHQALNVAKLEQIVEETSAPPADVKPDAESPEPEVARELMTREERFEAMAKQAEAKARQDRLGAGNKSVFQARMRDIGALGIGMQLYFMLTKYLTITFFLMGLVALPAIALNYLGNGMTSKMVDPLQLGYTSLGNEGVNSEIVNSTVKCLPTGDIDCSWDTVNTPFTSDPYVVTWILTLSDCSYSLVFLLFVLFYSYRAKQAIETHKNEHLTPARYAVLVRGLPRDATEKELVSHFNDRYDPTKDEEYAKLWFGCCWGRRRLVKAKRSLSKKAVNHNVVSNVEHLAGASTVTKELYPGTWLAEVSVAHPTGGLLRTFLSMETLVQSIKRTQALIRILEEEKSLAPAKFEASDEKLIHRSRKKLDKLLTRLNKAKGKIKVLKQVLPAFLDKKRQKQERRNSATKRDKLAAAAKAAKTAATHTEQAFNWEACECAFVVFNNLESQRRCLQDYRESTRWLPRKLQPKLLRFRDGQFPLIVTPAPEPSNILWENLEVTKRGRFYRQCVTSFVTLLLLVVSAVIVSAAQSAQRQFESRLPPEGLCDQSLPAVYYADTTFSSAMKDGKSVPWTLTWDKTAKCAASSSGAARYHVAYSNHIYYALDSARKSVGSAYPSPVRCLDPCVSEASTQQCNTLPCFYYKDLVLNKGLACETYVANHVLHCYCSTALTASIAKHGYLHGAKALWDNLPCRGYTKDYLVKNAFIVLAAGVVVIVNVLLNSILRLFAAFERHTSASTRTLKVAVRMFGAQFLNTAVIVLIVNAALGLSSVPVAGELLKGKYKDFERGWYPTVGMSITTTMLLNALLPQLQLFGLIYVVAPLRRWHKRRSIRTQEQMDKLYAGPVFDVSVRYPMVLNSVFVTLVFSGGSPVLLFIAAVTAAGTYWLDKLSILKLYAVKTAYDEQLGEVTVQMLPWTLALHLGFSAWMYGNTKLMKGHMLDLPWVLNAVGLSSIVESNPDATTDQLYALLVEKVGQYDLLGANGVLVKLVFSHVMLMTVLCFAVVLYQVLSALLGHVIFPVLAQVARLTKQLLLLPVALCYKDASEAQLRNAEHRRAKKKKKRRPDVVLPEFTEPFQMSVSRRYRADRLLGFRTTKVDKARRVVCVWLKDAVLRSGLTRASGERKRTWETMQAPVKSYAIEANDKYRLAVEELSAAWDLICQARHVAPVRLGKITPVSEVAAVEKRKESEVAEAITATEPVAAAAAEGQSSAAGAAADASESAAS
ncbi:hypothetical protein BBJ28_00011883 [Nothophytophthora sp. Chile5]|nr:hypothetical protein BBJ28_00011883 [Nothophytophthora sp. Chile5]